MSEADFDYKQLSEQEEQLNFDKLIPCPHCKKSIPEDATICLYCSREVNRYGKPIWLICGAIALLAILIISFLSIF